MPNTREKLIELLKLSNACLCDLCGEAGRADIVAGVIADNLIAHRVTVQECTTKCWDVCYNNRNIKYRCPHCETVFVYMYKNHIAPDACKECGAKLDLPQPPKGE